MKRRRPLSRSPAELDCRDVAGRAIGRLVIYETKREKAQDG